MSYILLYYCPCVVVLMSGMMCWSLASGVVTMGGFMYLWFCCCSSFRMGHVGSGLLGGPCGGLATLGWMVCRG